MAFVWGSVILAAVGLAGAVLVELLDARNRKRPKQEEEK